MLYELVSQSSSRNGLLEIGASDSGLEAYAFIFFGLTAERNNQQHTILIMNNGTLVELESRLETTKSGFLWESYLTGRCFKDIRGSLRSCEVGRCRGLAVRAAGLRLKKVVG
jgi:hypothetical protein